ncbi:hypothetical protein DNK47_02915 [Mycoplasma wenyonii]|uniref:Uncharacterized protein n=1 Tax=Mycoplasma wenyonii TaxID=65123 RepID=A0A328PUR1_9MOLU|nr:hypothetical protein [Mycoplasma wenyonii]RAO94839.1 hypothetical protein DNK47_02915 [Mycoplasma wenyonii]
MHKAKEFLEDTFKIHYKSKNSFPFPFFEYFKGNGCLTTFNTYIRSDMPVRFSRSSFDVPVREFDKSLKQSDYQKSSLQVEKRNVICNTRVSDGEK